MASTLEAYDAERPKPPPTVAGVGGDISSRSAITKGLRIEKLVKREDLTDEVSERTPSPAANAHSKEGATFAS